MPTRIERSVASAGAACPTLVLDVSIAPVVSCVDSSTWLNQALSGALLTDEEMRHPRDWVRYEDPFGDWHEEPCADRAEAADNVVRHTRQDGDPS